MLIHSARMGRLGTQRVTVQIRNDCTPENSWYILIKMWCMTMFIQEDQFLQMLESVKMQYERKTKVTIQRRKCFGEEEDDDPDGDLL